MLQHLNYNKYILYKFYTIVTHSKNIIITTMYNTYLIQITDLVL